MALGSAFPKELRSAAAERALSPGAVLKLRAVLDDGIEREKRFVVISVSDNALLCVMNSVIHPIIQRNPAMLRCQVKLAETLPFVDRECYLDCSRFRVLKSHEVTQQLLDDASRSLGSLTSDLRSEIKSALSCAPTLSKSDVAAACAALDAVKLD